MEISSDFQDLVVRLRDYDFDIPPFMWKDERYYVSNLVEHSIHRLNLEVVLSIYVEPKIKPLHLSDFRGEHRVDHFFDVTLEYMSLPRYNTLKYFWPREFLPRVAQLRQEVDTIIELQIYLERYISRREGNKFISERKQWGDSGFADLSWGQLFGKLVGEGNLRWAHFQGIRFPYVVTTSDVAVSAGQFVEGLFFVSADIASEPWQELVIACYGYLFDQRGPQAAEKGARDVAVGLGKLDEYIPWCQQVGPRFMRSP